MAPIQLQQCCNWCVLYFLRGLEMARWLDMKPLLLWLIRIYQLCLSPFFGGQCRFFPSCSDYAAEAVDTHGPLKGSWLAAGRLLRCHPWHAGGVDPVPPKGVKGEE